MKIISIKVTPNSSKSLAERDLLPDEHGHEHYKVWVSCPPEDGKANKAVIEIISDYLDVPKSKIKITKGLTGRNKLLGIDV